MAKDGVTITFRGGERLDRALANIAVTNQSLASKIVTSSLSAGATQVKKIVKKETPKAKKDTTGFKPDSTNISVGQLRNSLKSGLRNKPTGTLDLSSFIAGVWFEDTKDGSDEDGFFARFLTERHSPNKFGFAGGHKAFIKRAVKMAESNFKNKVGGTIAKKIAAFSQLKINKLG